MIIIRVTDPKDEREFLGRIFARFPGKTWANGDIMVPAKAIAVAAAAGFRFSVERPATYADFLPGDSCRL